MQTPMIFANLYIKGNIFPPVFYSISYYKKEYEKLSKEHKEYVSNGFLEFCKEFMNEMEINLPEIKKNKVTLLINRKLNPQ